MRNLKTVGLNTTLKISAVLLIAAALSSCGSNGVTGATKTPAPVYNPTSSSSSSSSSSGGSYDFYPAYSYSFSTYGQQPQVVSQDLTTDNLLKVKVIADAATRNQGTPVYTNFAAEYNCAQFKVILEQQVGSSWVVVSTKTTAPLKVVGTSGCTGSLDSETFDFSSYMTPGHGLVRIKVEAVKTDFYCQLFNKCLQNAQQYGYWSYDCYWAAQVNMSSYTCALKTVYQYHTVNGTMDVQTNGTTL